MAPEVAAVEKKGGYNNLVSIGCTPWWMGGHPGLIAS